MKTKSSSRIIITALLLQMVFVGTACAQEKSEHENEESGTQYSKTEKVDQLRGGIKLLLSYDKASSSFKGTMKNVSKKIIPKARVEVHLSNGVELGPTKAINMKPGQVVKVSLSAKNQTFKTWSTHAEFGSSEHGHGEEGEHSKREKGEHKKEGKGEHGKG